MSVRTIVLNKLFSRKKAPSEENKKELTIEDLITLERYDEALVVLNLVSNKQDPRILNYLGYATRKTGDVR